MADNTIRIKIEVSSWVAGALGLSEQGTIVIAKTLSSGTNIPGLFSALAAQSPQFAEKVYNPATGHPDPRLMIILNKKMVRGKDLARTVLRDGDVILLTPIIAGG